MITEDFRDHGVSVILGNASYCCFCFLFCLFVLLGPHPRHMEVPRLGVKSEL